MSENPTNGEALALTGKTGAEADAWTEQMILTTQAEIVPAIGPQQTIEALFAVMLFIAARNGADPAKFQHNLIKMAKGSARRIRLLRDIGGI